MSLFGAFNTECGQHASIHIKYLNTMVVWIGDDNAIGVRHGDVVWVFQLAFFFAAWAEFTHKSAIGLENLHRLSQL